VTRPLATVSVDVDTVDLHLLGYGFEGLPPDALVYTAALPRLLAIFARHGIRATFFVVARDGESQAAIIRRIEDEGHEIASHSLSHPMPFVRVPRSRLVHEVTESRRLLNTICRNEVIGFRAPNWDMSPRGHGPLVDAGYRYDASGFPSLFQVPVRLLLTAKSSNPRKTFRMRPWPWTLERLPFEWEIDGKCLIQFPISTSPRIRFPIYHTTRYVMGETWFVRHVEGFARRGEPFFYTLHGVDGLGLAEDAVDRRLERHPGLEYALADKLALLESSLAEIARRFDCVPYRDLVARLHLCEPEAGAGAA
jgi:hypothetical protein